MGHVSIRNPLQAPKERSCGINTHHLLLVPRSGTNHHQHYRGSVSPPSGNTCGRYGRAHVPTAALLRSLQWVSWHRSRSAEPAAHTQSACVRGCVATARRHSLLSLYRKLMCYLTAKQEFISESRLGRALQKPFSTYLLLAHPSGSWYRLANGLYESVALDTHPPNDIMSDAKASLCQQKKNIKNTRLRKGKVKNKKLSKYVLLCTN